MEIIQQCSWVHAGNDCFIHDHTIILRVERRYVVQAFKWASGCWTDDSMSITTQYFDDLESAEACYEKLIFDQDW